MNTQAEYLIFGDIAGRFDEMQSILDMVEKRSFKALPLALGDLNDRGSKSKQVIEYFINNGICVDSNHGHMMVDFVNDGKFYESGIWLVNGGIETIESYIDDFDSAIDPFSKEGLLLTSVKSFGCESLNSYLPHIRTKIIEEIRRVFIEYIPSSHIEFLGTRPKFFKDEGFIATHAPINPSIPFEHCLDIGKCVSDKRFDTSVLWNRGNPKEIKCNFQIHGHNTTRSPVEYLNKETKEVWGIGIDTSINSILTTMHWPSKEIFQQKYFN